MAPIRNRKRSRKGRAVNDERGFLELDTDLSDDEFEDARGSIAAGYLALYPGTMIAAVHVMHEMARRLPQRVHAKAPAGELLDTLRRRGGRRVSSILAARLQHLGTSRFDATLRRAAREAARRVGKMHGYLNETVNPVAVRMFVQLGLLAFLPRLRLTTEQAAALLSHLQLGATLSVGIGRGDLFLPEEQNVFDHRPANRVDIELAEIPAANQRHAVTPRSIVRVGDFPDDVSGYEVLVRLRSRLARVHYVLSYYATAESGSVIVTDDINGRLRIELPGAAGPLTLYPMTGASGAGP